MCSYIFRVGIVILFYRSYLFLFLVSLVFLGNSSAVHSASVPITDEFGVLGTSRNTCDPAFREVLSNRAWMEAQREVTQTQNLMARPDSVLAMSCFKQFLDHQAWYADNNFPGDPQNSAGGFGGVFTNLLVIGVDRIRANIDPSLSEGYTMFAVLEILVLDQLTDIRGNPISELLDIPGTALCGGDKDEYIDDNFPDFLLGDRAVTGGGYFDVRYGSRRLNAARAQVGPRYDEVEDGIGPFSNPPSYDCQVMNDIWYRAKCYDFAAESSLSGYGTAVDHDGFYTLLDYVALAASGSDYREHITRCDPPSGDLFDFPSAGDIACYTQTHGFPALPGFGLLDTRGGGGLANLLAAVALLTGEPGGPTWASASTASNPAVGTPGAADSYQTHADVLTGACSPPIQTGFLVSGFNNTTYIDAICPEPGCYFDPPTSTAAVGSCVAP